MGNPRERTDEERRRAMAAVEELIRWIGDDPAREGLVDTPQRVVDAFLEYFKGYEECAETYLQRTFEQVGGYDEVVLLRDIPFHSHCEHHMAPIMGKAHVAYLPKDRVVGISKLARVVHAYETWGFKGLTRELIDIGAQGTMLGVPMWVKMDLPTAVQFYRDVAEAVPDAAIAVYANPEAFKFDFPRPFWAEMSKIPQVVTAKYLGIGMLDLDLKLAPNIRFLPHEDDYYAAARINPERMTAFWSSGSMCGPATPCAVQRLPSCFVMR